MSRKVEVWDPGEIARRWYYTEQEFLASVRKVAAEIESWDALAGPELAAFSKAS